MKRFIEFIREDNRKDKDKTKNQKKPSSKDTKKLMDFYDSEGAFKDPKEESVVSEKKDWVWTTSSHKSGGVSLNKRYLDKEGKQRKLVPYKSFKSHEDAVKHVEGLRETEQLDEISQRLKDKVKARWDAYDAEGNDRHQERAYELGYKHGGQPHKKHVTGTTFKGHDVQRRNPYRKAKVDHSGTSSHAQYMSGYFDAEDE